MKTILIIVVVFFATNSNAQFFKKLSDKVEKTTEKTVEKKVEQKTEKTTGDAVDGVLKKKKKKTSDSESSTDKTESSTDKKNNKKAKSANDFVSGSNVIATEDFKQDAIGDFPVNWFTNSSGEVATLDDTTRWLQLSGQGSFAPTHINKLPENFTFEFDVYVPNNFSYYSTFLNIAFVETKKKTDYGKWSEYKKDKEGVIVKIHPQNAGTQKIGYSKFQVISEGSTLMENKVELPSFNQNKNQAKVQFWRQKNRLRMYVNGEKIWDLPNAFQDANYNGIVFYIYNYQQKSDKYYISNLQLAEAGSDTRHKLIETGTFTTNEILFETNKSNIKPQSEKVLTELGNALKDNPQIKISITGHTDSDGNDANNQKLSEQRAESVKNYLAKNFAIETSRIVTLGKGETEPITDNKTEEGKKKNRRVEFKVIQ